MDKIHDNFNENNLFYYATSELSQDAFICYLLSFAIQKYEHRDPALAECARTFLKACFSQQGAERCMPELPEPIYVEKIFRQKWNIDVLVKVGENYLIIEDKTFTFVHDKQIIRYTDFLHDKLNIPTENIVSVYYKSYIQPAPEKTADHSFLRHDILKMFKPYVDKTSDKIFHDYVQKIEEDEAFAEKYKIMKIQDWSSAQYDCFYDHLIRENIIKNAWWGHVGNLSGGFNGCWWSPITSRNLYKTIPQFTPDYLDDLYLQIEGSDREAIIALKYSLEKDGYSSAGDGGYDRKAIGDIRWGLHDQMEKILKELNKNVEFKKKPFRRGCYMTVGYIDLDERKDEPYDESICAERIKLMEKALLKLTDDLSKAKYDSTERRIIW